MKNKIEKIGVNLIVIYVSILSYIGYLLFYFNFDKNIDQTKMIYVMSWIGILIGIYIILTWYNLTGTYFSLYTIFMLFVFLFNYGQPLMWAIGIHQPKEIGQTTLYTLGIPSSGEIVLSQAIILVSIVLFHSGAMFSYKGKKKEKLVNFNKNINSEIYRNAIYKSSFYLSCIVMPITFYNILYKFVISFRYGYSSFYYNDELVTNIVAFNLIANMFFPCLLGLLIGSNYNKKNRTIVYIIFGIYMLISILSGDRGTWVMKLMILIWMSHTYYKNIRLVKSVKYILSTLIGLQLLDAVVSVRNTGINIRNIMGSFSFKESALISAIFEMGASMKPTIVLVKYGWDIWPYSNTYINALLSVVTSRTMNLIGRPWAPLSDWFSQTYLGISYGAGFSIIAESLINYGPLITPLFMILLGYIILSLTYIDDNNDIKNRPLKVFFAISTMSFLMGVIRNHFLWVLKSWFYGVIVFMIIILFVQDYIKKSKNLYRQ